uniref:Translocon-associated protein subunit gamma n=1 Tax=Elaeophora elaphi TaxID=1147741 RepID=A0A158Q933_9BILA
MIKKNQVAEAVVTRIVAASENNTNNVTAVAYRRPVQHALSSVQVAQMVPAQTSARQVGLPLTTRLQLKQEHLGIQTSSEFAAFSSPLQAFARVSEFDEAEDTQFLYYIVIFGAIIVCIYVVSHNKKKILGRRPSNSTRRSFRYRRLSQNDDSGSDLTNVIK